MRILFVKDELAWPRASGHDVHCYYMMRGLVRLGHDVGLVTRREPSPEALGDLRFCFRDTLDRPTTDLERSAPPFRPEFTSLQRRFVSYWGVDTGHIARIATARREMQADVLVGVGLDALPWLAAAPDACRVWYAADEWFLHHLSLVRPLEPSTWGALRNATIKLVYERAYAPLVDRAWVVSEADRRTMRSLAGMRTVDVIPNGVDGEHFQRPDQPVEPDTCVFWGRLDFEPNLQGLAWFCQHVWPRVRARVPNARLHVYGANPVPAALAFGDQPGVTVTANVPDLRPVVSRHAVAVLPFVTGGGIKNKILEAASLAMPIVCTRRACGGLRDAAPPFVATDDPEDWARELADLWRDGGRRESLGRRAREWVLAHHSWDVAAREAADGLAASLAARPIGA